MKQTRTKKLISSSDSLNHLILTKYVRANEFNESISFSDVREALYSIPEEFCRYIELVFIGDVNAFRYFQESTEWSKESFSIDCFKEALLEKRLLILDDNMGTFCCNKPQSTELKNHINTLHEDAYEVFLDRLEEVSYEQH